MRDIRYRFVSVWWTGGGKLALPAVKKGREDGCQSIRASTRQSRSSLRRGFAEGEASPEVFPEDEEVGRFSEGQEDLPAEEDPEKLEHGRFSKGQEELPEEDPEKHEERRFSEGQDMEPPGYST